MSGLWRVYWGNKHKVTQDLDKLAIFVLPQLTCKHTVAELWVVKVNIVMMYNKHTWWCHTLRILALEVSTNLWLFIQLPPALLPVCRLVSSYLFQAFMTALCVYVNWMHLVVTNHVSCQRHCPLLGKGRSGCWEPKSRPCLCMDGAGDGAFHLVLFIQQTKTWLYTRLSPLDLPLHGINSCDVEVLNNFHTVDEISGLRLGPAPAAFQCSWRVLTLPGTCVSL